MGDMIGDLKQQGVAVMVMVGIAILSVLAMVILNEFESSIPNGGTTTTNATVAAFIAGFAIVGTFATVTMLIIVVKGIIGVVKGLQ